MMVVAMLAVLAGVMAFAGVAQARKHHSVSKQAKASRLATVAVAHHRCGSCNSLRSSKSRPAPQPQSQPQPQSAPTAPAQQPVSAPQPRPAPVSVPAPDPTPEPEVGPAQKLTPPSNSIYLGATVDGSVYGEGNPPWNMKALETYQSHIGRKVAILQVHQDWGNIYPDVLESIRARGAVPMLITEYNTLSQITNGSQDSKIRAMNAALAAYGGPVIFRFDWEFNGDWYPWGGLKQAPEWVAAYKHVHDLMSASNISWLWSANQWYPNVKKDHEGDGVPVDPTPWYPGNAYVDWVGADCYNFGGESFQSLVDPIYNLSQKIAPGKPIMLPEWGATNNQGKKAAMINEAFKLIPSRYPAIKAMVYFNATDGGAMDWPIEQLSSAQAAYKAGATLPYFSAVPNLTGKLAVP